MRKGFALLPVLILTLLLLVTVNVVLKNNTNSIEPPTINEPTPKLPILDYEEEILNNGWIKVTSRNYNFEILVPKGTDLTVGGGFNKEFPQNELKGLMIGVPENLANVSVGVNFQFIQTDNLKLWVEETAEIEETQAIGENSITKVVRKNINNTSGYEYYRTSEWTNYLYSYYSYYTMSKDYHIYLVYSYPFTSTNLTGNEKQTVQKIISSFRFLED